MPRQIWFAGSRAARGLPSAQHRSCCSARCRIRPPDGGSRQWAWVTALLTGTSGIRSGSGPKPTPTERHDWRDTSRPSGACSSGCGHTGRNWPATRRATTAPATIRAANFARQMQATRPAGGSPRRLPSPRLCRWLMFGSSSDVGPEPLRPVLLPPSRPFYPGLPELYRWFTRAARPWRDTDRLWGRGARGYLRMGCRCDRECSRGDRAD